MYAIIDIETTGLNAVSDKITEIAIFIHDGNKIVNEFVSLVNPERKIPYRITHMTGINNKMTESSPVAGWLGHEQATNPHSGRWSRSTIASAPTTRNRRPAFRLPSTARKACLRRCRREGDESSNASRQVSAISRRRF